MNQQQTKAHLISKGWMCKPCSCPGAKSFDCLHSSYKGFSIKLKPAIFRIMNKGLTIASGQYTRFEETIKKYELDKTTA